MTKDCFQISLSAAVLIAGCVRCYDKVPAAAIEHFAQMVERSRFCPQLQEIRLTVDFLSESIHLLQ